MSRSPKADAGATGTVTDDAGFSLVEVVVALGILMIVSAAVLPQLIVGIRGAALANEVTEAKGVIQGQLERMRNLPFHVAPSAERRIDVLDSYYPDLQGPVTPTFECEPGGEYARPATGWTGYVDDGTRCAYEPADGPFYRKVETLTREDGAEYVLVTDTQFLNSSSAGTGGYAPTAADLPADGYNSQNTHGLDVPVSTQIGVTVTAFYTERGRLRRVSTYTEISEERQPDVRLRGKANATALEVGSTTPNDRSLSISAGVVNLSGSLSRASNATADVAGSSARLSTNAPAGSLVGPVAAPFSLLAAREDSGGSVLETCTYICWGASVLEPFAVTADGGLPNAGSSTTPVEGRLKDTLTNSGVSFRNTKEADAPSLYRPGLMLDASKPLVRLDATGDVAPSSCGTSRGGVVSGRGFLTTTASTVDTCAEAASTVVSLFPTSFAPQGVVRIKLTSAATRCTVNTATDLIDAGYQYAAEVQYADPDPASASGYQTVLLSGSNGALPATDVLQTLLAKPVGDGMLLGDYIDSWSSPTAGTVTAPKLTGKSAEAALPGVIKILSQPVRTRRDTQPVTEIGDPTSVVSLTLGAVGCFSEDSR